MVMVPMCSVTNAGHHHNSLHQDKTLLLCWPPQHSPMALNALCSYRGDQVVYIGEWEHNVPSELQREPFTADPAFRQTLV
eukprot:4411338-Pyramimonas_sp.AAC.2